MSGDIAGEPPARHDRDPVRRYVNEKDPKDGVRKPQWRSESQPQSGSGLHAACLYARGTGQIDVRRNIAHEDAEAVRVREEGRDVRTDVAAESVARFVDRRDRRRGAADRQARHALLKMEE